MISEYLFMTMYLKVTGNDDFVAANSFVNRLAGGNVVLVVE